MYLYAVLGEGEVELCSLLEDGDGDVECKLLLSGEIDDLL